MLQAYQLEAQLDAMLHRRLFLHHIRPWTMYAMWAYGIPPTELQNNHLNSCGLCQAFMIGISSKHRAKE